MSSSKRALSTLTGYDFVTGKLHSLHIVGIANFDPGLSIYEDERTIIILEYLKNPKGLAHSSPLQTIGAPQGLKWCENDFINRKEPKNAQSKDMILVGVIPSGSSFSRVWAALNVYYEVVFFTVSIPNINRAQMRKIKFVQLFSFLKGRDIQNSQQCKVMSSYILYLFLATQRRRFLALVPERWNPKEVPIYLRWVVSRIRLATNLAEPPSSRQF